MKSECSELLISAFQASIGSTHHLPGAQAHTRTHVYANNGAHNYYIYIIYIGVYICAYIYLCLSACMSAKWLLIRMEACTRVHNSLFATKANVFCFLIQLLENYITLYIHLLK